MALFLFFQKRFCVIIIAKRLKAKNNRLWEFFMRRFFYGWIGVIVSAVILAGCTGQPEDSSAPSQPAATPAATAAAEPTASASLTPEPVDLGAVEEEAGRIWEEEVRLELSAYVPENLFDGKGETRFLAGDDESRAWLPQCAEEVNAQIDAGADAVTAALREKYGITARIDCAPLNWQMIYTALMTQGSAEGAEAVLKQIIAPEIEAETDQDGALEISLASGPYDYREAAKRMEDEMSAKFLYAYVLTVYDDEGREVEYVEREETGNLAAGITWPLESHTNLRKTWYAARDKGARKHTGTDIWAKEDTEIYSCTDGTVKFIGSNSGMGNAVIIEDEYGYEFHYYHMVRLTDFLKEGDRVQAGQLVGHVGNTGNSVRDHLHLTIVAPDGYFVNPYPYLKEIEP